MIGVADSRRQLQYIWRLLAIRQHPIVGKFRVTSLATTEEVMPIESDDTAVPLARSINEALTESDAAARLGLKVATLRAWRHQGRGPSFVRLGRAIRYLSIDLDEFLKANRHRPPARGQQ